MAPVKDAIVFSATSEDTCMICGVLPLFISSGVVNTRILIDRICCLIVVEFLFYRFCRSVRLLTDRRNEKDFRFKR